MRARKNITKRIKAAVSEMDEDKLTRLKERVNPHKHKSVPLTQIIIQGCKEYKGRKK